MNPLHHHPNDGIFRPDCARCKLEHAAPKMPAGECPPLSCGLYYGEGPDGERVCRGAGMGRSNTLPPEPLTASPKLFLRRLRFIDGCYDEGGAYWGAPENLYRAACCLDGLVVEVFVRADSHEQAKQLVRGSLPHARFYH